MGTILSFLMIISGLIIMSILKKKMETNKFFFKKSKVLPVDKFFKNVLYDKKNGYYSSRIPFGKKGDFITSPKVSSLFSEIIAIWMIACWETFGNLKILIL